MGRPPHLIHILKNNEVVDTVIGIAGVAKKYGFTYYNVKNSLCRGHYHGGYSFKWADQKPKSIKASNETYRKTKNQNIL